jgi:hypothetical protein
MSKTSKLVLHIIIGLMLPQTPENMGGMMLIYKAAGAISFCCVAAIYCVTVKCQTRLCYV